MKLSLKAFSLVFLTVFFIALIFTSLPEKIFVYIFNQVKGINSQNFTASLLQENNEPEGMGEEQPDETPQSGDSDGPVTMPAEQVLVEDLIDNLKEKIDIIQQQILELKKQQLEEESSFAEASEDKEDLEEDEEKNLEEYEQNNQAESCVGQINLNTASLAELDKIIEIGPVTAQKIIEARLFYSLDDLLKVSGIGEATLLKIRNQGCAFVDSNIGPTPTYGGGGGGSPVLIVYPKILISEIQVFPANKRFIELYNPGDNDVVLENWYLQRKDSNDVSWNSLISHAKFEKKSISANGYFLISREIGSSDIFYDFALSDNNSLALKNPNGEISDQTIFSVIEEDKSFGRKVLENNVEKDTDNDAEDFELNKPTPRAQNIKWEDPEIPKPVDVKNILINEIQINPITQRFVELYNPNSFDVDLEGYYLQRKTATAESWSSFVSSTNFQEKKIPGKGFFLISRELEGSDILLAITLSDNNSLVLKNANREIVDKVGYGSAQDFDTASAINPLTGQSISRVSGTDTNNNSADFIILDMPTPKAQ